MELSPLFVRQQQSIGATRSRMGWSLAIHWLGGPLLLALLLTVLPGWAARTIAAPQHKVDGGATINCPGALASELTSASLTGSGVISATIGDLVWLDANSNGIRDETEVGVADVEVTATCSNSDVSATATTDQRGTYFFIVENPAASSILLTFAPPPGHTLTLQSQGNDPKLDSDPDPMSGQTAAITVSAGNDDLDQDAGLIRTVQPPAICGTIYNDLSGTGQIDRASPTLAAFQVAAIPTGSNDPVGMATSMVNGRYCIALPTSEQVQQYNVRQLPVDGWTTTLPKGDIPSYQVTVAPGTIVGNIDFANYNPITKLCGLKYHDINGNGIKDPGEPPLAGWTFEVTNGSGTVVNSATTGDDAASASKLSRAITLSAK